MGILSSGRGIRPKRFDYEPRFYNPKKEEKIKQRMRVQRLSKAKRRSPAGIIYFLLLFAMATYVYVQLGG
ncbi:MAG: hypothetical protein HOC28_02355 [Bacteroidetes Order II. Incertae sedis bacterium]|jgi:hypothetical protein|nr:hypothetical protein [Bacteroidetes Order II. bacterium]MDG1753954.1 hypothetical protein [Rhodothermales bacterium]HAY35714.1 hypothetical protein [Bacteroidota bacterium]MBT4052333.1 hypothetical protein [Bacteroidetes Order II. bacterium]MBT4601954.1 hypothetical protein [Bacteroidetes Order II. bacterium]